MKGTKHVVHLIWENFKLNRVDVWIIPSKYTVEFKKLKDNYSSSLESMSKTFSHFLIILTMTHMMEFVSSAVSVFVTWDVIWILMMSTFFSNLHMVREYIYVYTNLWDGRVPVLMDLEVQVPWGSLMFLIFLWKLARRLKQRLLSCLIPQFNRTGVILLKLVVCLWSKSLHQLFPRQRCQQCLFVFINAKRIWRIPQAHRIPL